MIEAERRGGLRRSVEAISDASASPEDCVGFVDKTIIPILVMCHALF
jgi:hypothetical protein